MSDPLKTLTVEELHVLQQRAQNVYKIASAALLDNPELDWETQTRLAGELQAALGSDDLVSRYLAAKTVQDAAESE